MRIWVEEEHLAELSLVEEVAEIFHRVGPDASDIVVFSWVQDPQNFNSVLNVVGNLYANLHTDGDFIRISFTQGDQESSIAATNWN